MFEKEIEKLVEKIKDKLLFESWTDVCIKQLQMCKLLFENELLFQKVKEESRIK